MAVSVSVSVFGVDTIWGKKEESLKLVGVPGFFVELLARFVCIFAPSGKNNCSHQCLHWWQQHATGMLRFTLFKSVYCPKIKPIRMDGLYFWSC